MELLAGLAAAEDKVPGNNPRTAVMRPRLAKLAGGVAVIKVGAPTETAMMEKKARVEDTMNATRAAVEEGIVAGGGVALLRASKAVDRVKGRGRREGGALIVKRALEEPIRQIVENAGLEGSVIVETGGAAERGVDRAAAADDRGAHHGYPGGEVGDRAGSAARRYVLAGREILFLMRTAIGLIGLGLIGGVVPTGFQGITYTLPVLAGTAGALTALMIYCLASAVATRRQTPPVTLRGVFPPARVEP